MLRAIATALFCSVIFLEQSRGQDVFVPRQPRVAPVAQSEKEDPPELSPDKETPSDAPAKKAQSTKTEPEKVPAPKGPTTSSASEKRESVKTEVAKVSTTKAPSTNARSENVSPTKFEPTKALPGKKLATAPSDDAAPAKASPVTELPKRPSEKIQAAKDPEKESPATTRSEKAQTAKADAGKSRTEKESPVTARSEKGQSAQADPAKSSANRESPVTTRSEKVQSAKVDAVKSPAEKESPVTTRSEKVVTAKSDALKSQATKEPLTDPVEKSQSAKLASANISPAQESAEDVRLLSSPVETASTRLADGFDFPVGKPDAVGYYKARGFRPGGHVGEDWDGARGGDSDFKDPIFCIGDGVVVFARDVRRGWGNVVIVRHGYREKGGVQYIDSLYGHLHTMMVKRGQKVARGQQLGTMGTAHGRYDAHLHLEIRKNIEIGMSRAKFDKSFSNYHDPTQFITSHRRLAGGGQNFRVAMNTFTHDSAFHFDDAPKFSSRKRGAAESR